MSQDSGPALSDSCRKAAEALFSLLDAKRQKIAFAESCTGGLAASALTEIAGASRVFWGGIVSYSEDAKMRLLSVPQSTIEEFGVVSKETAVAMAQGALLCGDVDFAAAVTGFAGPDTPLSEAKAGRVCFAWGAKSGALKMDEERFKGDRKAIRLAACMRLLEGSIAMVEEN